MRSWTLFALIVLCMLALSASARAQGFGRMVGTVSDTAGAVIPNAKVTATEAGKGFLRTAGTDSSGYFVLDSLRPAQYDLSIEATGFQTFNQKAVTLLADQTLTLNVNLQVGTLTATVPVEAGASQVDTATPTLKQVIELARISELPSNGRNVAELTLSVPGSSGFANAPNPTSGTAGGALQGATKTFPGAVAIAVNGARQNQISYQLDGGNYVDEYTNVNQPFPMPDALQEFSVQTSNYTAEYGQNAGAVVNIITKSGSNKLHGSAFEFVRTPALNARRWDQPTKDQIHRHQFGGTIGGSIRRDRTFFFGAYQGTVFHNVLPTTSQPVPNAAQRASATDPAVTKLLSFIPVGDASGRASFARPDLQNFQELTARVDHAFSRKTLMAVRYFYDRFTRNAVFEPNNILTYSDGSTIRSQNLLVHLTYISRPTLINDFRFSFAPETAQRGPAAKAISVQDLGVSIPFQPTPKAIQQIRVNGGFSFGDNPTASFARKNFTISDDVSWIVGSHDLHLGGVIERSRIDLDNQFFQPAEFDFPSITAFLAGELGDFSGNPAFRQGAGEFKNNRNTFAGLYIQDNYHISRRLMLNFGLRWEPALPWKEIKGRVEQFRLAGLIAGTRSTQFPNAPPGVYFPGDAGVPKDGVRPSLNNFAPRVGFAYDVFGDSKTSLRGGFGIFYDIRIPGIINNRFVDVTPFSPQLLLLSAAAGPEGKPGTFSDPLCALAATQAARGCTAAANLFPAPFPPPSTSAFAPNLLVVSWDPNNKYQVPTLYNWNLAIERQLPSDVLVRAAYVGSHGSHLKETIAFNVSPVGGGTPRLNLIAGPNVFGTTNNGPTQDLQDINSSYHSLQLSLERRMIRGVTILANYTWSKSIDDLPPGGGVTDIGADSVSARPWDDPLRHQFDRGPSDFDRKHNFVASFVWQLPRLSKSNSLLRSFMGNWQLGGIVSARTGRPLTIVSGTDRSGTGIGQDRAKLVGPAIGPGACATAGITTKPCKDWLNPVAFVEADLGTFGNVGKGSIRFPGYYAWDMSLSKSFSIKERWKLQLRGEFFNIFNRVNFLSDDGTVGPASNFAKVSSTSSFGAITAATDPRIGQLAVKLIF
jgi:Carboxypeptidase regulatory-like domain